VGFVCVFRGFLILLNSATLSLLTTLSILLFPRLLYLLYDVVNGIMVDRYLRTMAAVLQYVTEQTIITLVVNNPTRTISKNSSRGKKIFSFYLYIEPILHLGFWVGLSYFVDSSRKDTNSLFIVVFSLTFLLFYGFHALFLQLFLPYTLKVLKDWKYCMSILVVCERILTDLTIIVTKPNVSPERVKYFATKLLDFFIRNRTVTEVYKDEISRMEDVEKAKALAKFYKNNYALFGEEKVRSEFLDRSHYFPVLIDFIMIRITLFLLKTSWPKAECELKEDFDSLVYVVLAYITFKTNPKNDKLIQNLGSYYKFFSDSKQEYNVIQIMNSNRGELPRLFERITYWFV